MIAFVSWDKRTSAYREAVEDPNAPVLPPSSKKAAPEVRDKPQPSVSKAQQRKLRQVAQEKQRRAQLAEVRTPLQVHSSGLKSHADVSLMLMDKHACCRHTRSCRSTSSQRSSSSFCGPQPGGARRCPSASASLVSSPKVSMLLSGQSKHGRGIHIVHFVCLTAPG